jgi:glycosyltransferase involved in cell wall biosynthesis
MAASIHATAGCHDVLHVAEARGIHVQWVHRAALRSSVPYVWAAYGGLARGTGLRRLYRRANDIILNTKRLIEGASCQVYKSFGARTEQIRQIPLCVDFAELAVPRSTGSFRQRMGIGPRTRIVLFLGRIHQTKGVDLLVDAFAIVASKSSACVLVIVGWDHGFKARLIRRIARLGLNGRVLFCDALFGQDRLAAYTDANVVAITPRVYEETSLAALEACACGTGVVVTKQCEIPGLEGAGVGRIVAAAARPIAEAIEELLSSDPTADVRERRERFVRLRFSSETVAQEYLRVFGESRCLADPAGR